MATSFAEFFGLFVPPGGDHLDDDMAYAFQLELDSAGKAITAVEQDGSLKTFNAIVCKEKKEKVETENGYTEVVTRKVSFPTNDDTGRAVVRMFQEIRIGSVKYQIRSFEDKGAYWLCILHRANLGEASRPNRRGRV